MPDAFAASPGYAPTTAWLVPQILWAHRLSSSRRCLGRARMKKRTKNFRKLWIQWYQRWLARTWLRRSTFFANCTHRCAWPYHLRSHACERVPFPATYALGAFALLSPEPPHLKRQGGGVVLGGNRFFQMRVGKKPAPIFQHILMGGGLGSSMGDWSSSKWLSSEMGTNLGSSKRFAFTPT